MGRMANRRSNTTSKNAGQSLVEFALILPLFVLIIIGVFDLGRAYFAYIAISNAAREGARVATFWPGKTTRANIDNAIYAEIGNSSLVDTENIADIDVQCGDPLSEVPVGVEPINCETETPILVTVTYSQTMILSFFFPEPLMLVRSTEMMMP
jgi:Flp pilus assembly protein TadG